MTETFTLVLLRHGESEWNAKNLFTGWVDVDLNDQGREEAARGGELLVENNILPDVLYTSLLKRAINTANITLDKADRGWIPVKRDWRLNERHYGALQGKDKAQTLAEFGEEQFMEWRRSYDTPPPPLSDDSEFSQAHDPRYADLGDALPRTARLHGSTSSPAPAPTTVTPTSRPRARITFTKPAVSPSATARSLSANSARSTRTRP